MKASSLFAIALLLLASCASTRPAHQALAPDSIALRLASFSGAVSQRISWDIENAPGWLLTVLPDDAYPPNWKDFSEMFCTNYPIGTTGAPLVVKKFMHDDAQVSVDCRHEIQTYKTDQGDFTKSFWLTCKNATIPLNTWTLISGPGTDDGKASGLFVRITTKTTQQENP